MNYKVGVFAKGSVSSEAIAEAKRALQEVAMKYNCRFEVSNGENSSNTSANLKSNFKARWKSDNKSDKRVHLSFGGELEL